jgi:hypothetical protein
MATAMKKGDLNKANRLDREIKSIGDGPTPTAFDFRSAISSARYYSDTTSFDVSGAVVKLATENKIEIPKKLWSIIRADPKPGGGPKYLQLSFDCGAYVVDFRTELPDDISPVLTVTPKKHGSQKEH